MENICEISLPVQWLRLSVSIARGMGSVPGWGTKILNAMLHCQRKKMFEKKSLLLTSYLPAALCSVMANSATPWTVACPLGFSVHGIFQARILEWVVISYSIIPPCGPAKTRLQTVLELLHWI